MEGPFQVQTMPVGQTVDAQAALAAGEAVKGLDTVSKGLNINYVAGRPGVVTVSQLGQGQRVETGAQILGNIDTILGQVEPTTSIDALLGQQIPAGEDEADSNKRTRAKNAILATLVSLPPSERAAVMQNPERLRVLCKNAIFGSLVSGNDKVCAICASNMQRSPAYILLGSLPKEKQSLAYWSLNCLEMLMAGSGIGNDKKEEVRKQAMAFFSKATIGEGEWKFPKSSDEEGSSIALKNDNKALETLALAHLLRFIDQESRGQLPLGKVHMQKEDGGIDASKTVKAFIDELQEPTE
jgi:hypothetical protein